MNKFYKNERGDSNALKQQRHLLKNRKEHKHEIREGNKRAMSPADYETH